MFRNIILFFFLIIIPINMFGVYMQDWSGDRNNPEKQYCSYDLNGTTTYKIPDSWLNGWVGWDNPNGFDRYYTDGVYSTQYYCIDSECPIGKKGKFKNPNINVDWSDWESGEDLDLLFEGDNFMCVDDNQTYKIYFSNGMFTEEEEAGESLNKLKETIDLIYQGSNKIEYGIAYNQNENVLFQIFEVVSQKGIDIWSSFYSYLSGIKDAPDWFKDTMLEVSQLFDKFNYVLDEDLQKQVEAYQKDLDEGKKVVVIAHSQGNFYANRAYGNLNNPNFKIVSVATPANKVAGDGRHTTSTDDLIIKAIALIDLTTLYPNVTNTNQTNDNLGHSFLYHYMQGNKSNEKIFNDIEKAME